MNTQERDFKVLALLMERLNYPMSQAQQYMRGQQRNSGWGSDSPYEQAVGKMAAKRDLAGLEDLLKRIRRNGIEKVVQSYSPNSVTARRRAIALKAVATRRKRSRK